MTRSLMDSKAAQPLCALMRSNERISLSETARCANTERSLTRSLDIGEEGLAMQATRICSVDGCDRKHWAGGWCQGHYNRWSRTGDPGIPDFARRVGVDTYERFLSHVDTSAGPDACHPWNGSRYPSGYGCFRVNRRSLTATRWLLGYLRGEQLRPDELVLHRCDNPPCCNERHLYIGDQPQNMQDAVERGRHKNSSLTHCRRGHEFTPENTYLPPGRLKPRGCRACRASESRERYLRKKASMNEMPVTADLGEGGAAKVRADEAPGA